ncbi:MAG TPA: G1 family glutamic endopeptidase [Candidatus Limnocylindrales bacterium]|nr:G1 family glutamic endopeptidase [Candidatus Limnocylindrales bacterium]
MIALSLTLALAACTGSVDLGDIGRQLGGSPSPTTNAGDQRQVDAVKQAIERANQAQATAFNSGNAAVMRDTATDDFYAQLVEANRGLASSGVRSIELVSIDYSGISVDGANATATTLETWRSTYSDGSADEATARNDYTLVLQSGAWKIATNEQPSAVLQPGPPSQTDPSVPAAASSVSTSSNWSGYSASGGSFTSVTGTWTVPTVAATINGADATWVGIGGIDTRDLIQAGTQATVSGGDVTYNAWIEMLPASSKPISLSVNPGDSVTVSITQKTALDWTIELRNNTTGGRYNTTVQYRSTNSSAEWVQEAPSTGGGLVPLDAFGTLRFMNATAVRDGVTVDLRAAGAHAITMVNGARQPLAVPSVIGDDGASFAVTRTDAQSTSSAGTQRRRRG